MATIEWLAVVLGGYLWGSLSPADVITRWRHGVDLRRYGTGNVGSANLGEQLGLGWKVAVGLLDIGKGALPVALARAGGLAWPVVISLGLAVVVGHNWSAYLGGRGGRGVATALGVLLGWEARLTLVVLACFAAGAGLRREGPGSLLGFLALSPAAWALAAPLAVVMGAAALALLIAVKRLEANGLALPAEPQARRAVLWRRLWLDRDVPLPQVWEKRGRFR